MFILVASFAPKLFDSLSVGNVPNTFILFIGSGLLLIISNSTSNCFPSSPFPIDIVCVFSCPTVSIPKSLMLFIAVTSVGATICISLEAVPTSSLFIYSIIIGFVAVADFLFTIISAFIIIVAPSIDCSLYCVCLPANVIVKTLPFTV